MTASIDTSGIAKMSSSLRRTISGSLQKEMTANLHARGPKIVSEMKGSASTPIQRHAASTIDVARDSRGITLSGGGSGGLGGILFNGGEYGGRKSKKVAYATRSPRGNAYVVRRRTTMMFLPHLGTTGYMFWPTYRDWLPRLVKEQEEIIDRAMGGR